MASFQSVLSSRQLGQQGKVVTWELSLACGHTVTRTTGPGGTYWIPPGPKVKCPQNHPGDKPAVQPTRAQAAPKREYQKVLEVQRRNLSRLAEGRSAAHLKKLYDAAQDELEAKLRRLPLGKRDTFTAHQHNVLLAQAKQGQALIAQRMAGDLGDLSREAQVDSLRGLSSMIETMEEEFTGAAPVLPIEEASRFWGVIDQRRTSLMRAHETSMANYGARVAGSIEKELGLSLATGESTVAAIDRVRAVAGNEWWQAERIVRTETAWAFNATTADGIVEAAQELPQLYMRWVEHVSDSGVPLDNRVGVDSLAMHGQVARPGGYFTMPDSAPNGEEVSDSLVGQSWKFPPNRPNDRSSLSAWMPSWGSPGWIWDGARRVPVTR